MVEVRAATPGDLDAIRRIHLAAFPTAVEADLVEKLVHQGDAVVSLVASDRGKLVGHILFSRMQAQCDGRAIDALGLAPVAVLPDRQREGIGSALIQAGLSEARVVGAEIVFVLGEPVFYGRFGFDAAMAAPFASAYAGPYLQVKALSPEFIPPSDGSADYAAAFGAFS